MIEKKEQTWLILAHCFNQDGRAASLTITDKIPFFKKLGVRPVVLSAATGKIDTNFPHYQIFSPGPSGIRFEVRHWVKNLTLPSWLKFLIKYGITIPTLPLYALEKLIFRYDSQWTWHWAAFWKAQSLVKKYHPDLIYSSAGPPSTHEAAYLLAKKTGIPWLAEIYDPIIIEPPVVSPPYQRYKARIEKLIADHAQGVIYFTEVALASATRRHPHLKGHLVRPGVGKPDFDGVAYQRGKVLKMGHFGSLAKDRTLVPLILALKEWVKAYPEWRDKVELHIYGAEPDEHTRHAISKLDNPAMIVSHGRLEYDTQSQKSGRQRVLEAMKKMDTLVVIHGDDRVAREYVPSKSYEYFWSARPVFGIVGRETEFESLLRQRGHFIAQENNHEEILKIVKILGEKWLENKLGDLPKPIPLRVEDAVSKIHSIGTELISAKT